VLRKVNHTLRVKQSRPYIGTHDDNRLRVLGRVIGEKLEETCRVILALRFGWMQCGALELACSFRCRALRRCKFRPRVNGRLVF